MVARKGSGARQAVCLFVPVWCVGSVINLTVGVGVVSAGYGVAQEPPILIVVFGVPALIAVLIARWVAAGAQT